jgi:hypothetical protein
MGFSPKGRGVCGVAFRKCVKPCYEIQNMKSCKLVIIEPWEIGTDKPINAVIVDHVDGRYLLQLSKPREINGSQIQFLIAELRDRNVQLDPFAPKRGTYVVNMVYSISVTLENFKTTRPNDFRSNFALGEIVL